MIFLGVGGKNPGKKYSWKKQLSNKYPQIWWIFWLWLISYFKSRINSVLKILIWHVHNWEFLHYWSREVADIHREATLPLYSFLAMALREEFYCRYNSNFVFFLILKIFKGVIGVFPHVTSFKTKIAKNKIDH